MSHFQSNSLTPDPGRRARIIPILDAALDAVNPENAVLHFFRRSGDNLWVGDKRYRLDDYRRIFVLAFGKAAAPMAQAVVHGLGARLDGGFVITKYGHAPQDAHALTPLQIIEAGHPVPDAMGAAAAQRATELIRNATADDLLITLISGGGSALFTLPAPDISLSDLQQTTDLLLSCGAAINEMNTVRKHLSQVKGGQLARLAAPATIINLILSDVVGSPVDVIASGPTAPDSSTWCDAWRILANHNLIERLPTSVRRRLQAGLKGDLPDTPKPGDPIFGSVQTIIVGDNAIAAEAAQVAAENQGFNAAILSTFIQGEAREVAQVLVGLGREVAVHKRPLSPPACLILGGETTVTLHGHGKGGRNQEMALAAGLALSQASDSDPIIIVTLATDGTDGPTDAAGGIADADSAKRGEKAGLNIQHFLEENNAYPYLKATNDLLISGPTRTNVNDLYLIFIFTSP